MQLHFQLYGHSGPPLVILHGLFGSHDNWQSVSRKLGEQFRVFVPDQRNHGASPHSPEMTYPIMAEDVLEFLQAQQLAGVHLLGHSMGGKTAMQFALTHPGKVQKLVVVDISSRAYSSRHKAIFEGLLSLDLSSFHTRKEIEDALEPKIPEADVRRFLLKSVAHEPGGGFRWKINLQSICDNYGHLSAAVSAGGVFGGPTLFIRGEHSNYMRPNELETLRRQFPRAELHTIPGASHWVHAQAPALFLHALWGFLLVP